MVLEAVDEVICISKPFIIPDRAEHPAPARWPPSHDGIVRSANQDTYWVLDDLGVNFGRV